MIQKIQITMINQFNLIMEQTELVCENELI